MIKVDGWKAPPKISVATERRRHQRLRLQVPAQLILPGTNVSISVLNQEISWGGAVFTVAQPLPKGIHSVLIVLPWVGDQRISIHATVLRMALLPNNQYLLVVRFSNLMPESHLRLEKLLKMISGKARTADRQASTDLFHEVQVTVFDLDDFRQTLEQIAAGRFILHAVDGYDLNQSISLAVAGPHDLPELRLRARVVDIDKAHSIRFDGSGMHLVTLEFEHPREAITPLIDSLLGRLPQVPGASAVVGSSGAAKPLGTVVSDTHCAIETDLPAVLDYLIAIWGDHQAFSAFFLELLGVGLSGCPWPAAIWEEITLLQSLHYQMYGAKSRTGAMGPARRRLGDAFLTA
ncbi:PilZ domain-containing protein [uncultured Thiodictyon sp.]|uniref:PilZ domain-containing protein n=1 Tax=uncultured Thiodictyon sp. TaxID=1846217 RepID=UPI0025DA9104|nr:PilZ domain-containing protein [uncultured Thiodictyon sp.]